MNRRTHTIIFLGISYGILAALLGYAIVTNKLFLGTSTETNLPPGVTTLPPESSTISYTNSEYGFELTLPKSWQGYTTVVDTWKGLTISESQGEVVAEQGTQISLRHPLWTTAEPRQDIPIMVFTLGQWQALQQEKFHIGAAPIGPSELGRNARYAFALPARYNFTFPTGYEEVDAILQGKPLHTF